MNKKISILFIWTKISQLNTKAWWTDGFLFSICWAVAPFIALVQIILSTNALCPFDYPLFRLMTRPMELVWGLRPAGCTSNAERGLMASSWNWFWADSTPRSSLVISPSVELQYRTWTLACVKEYITIYLCTNISQICIQFTDRGVQWCKLESMRPYGSLFLRCFDALALLWESHVWTVGVLLMKVLVTRRGPYKLS